MKIWKSVQHAWQDLLGTRDEKATATEPPGSAGEGHLALARENLRDLLQDTRVPAPVREALAEDYAQVERMLDKLEHGHIHIAAFGRVGVGKSSMLNALLGAERFSVSALHGETRKATDAEWSSYEGAGVYLIDTPGINEIDGEAREALARDVASRVDLVLFVADGDLTDTELDALRTLTAQQRPVMLVLNKTDRYSADDIALLIRTLDRTHQRPGRSAQYRHGIGKSRRNDLRAGRCRRQRTNHANGGRHPISSHSRSGCGKCSRPRARHLRRSMPVCSPVISAIVSRKRFCRHVVCSVSG